MADLVGIRDDDTNLVLVGAGSGKVREKGIIKLTRLKSTLIRMTTLFLISSIFEVNTLGAFSKTTSSIPKVTATIPINGAVSIKYDPVHNEVYVAGVNYGSGFGSHAVQSFVNIYRGTKEIGTVKLENSPDPEYWDAFTKDTKKGYIYVLESPLAGVSNEVEIINGTSVVNKFDVYNANSIVYDSDNGYLYEDTDIDGTANQENIIRVYKDEKWIGVIKFPQPNTIIGMAYDPADHRLYVTYSHKSQSGIYVIQGLSVVHNIISPYHRGWFSQINYDDANKSMYVSEVIPGDPNVTFFRKKWMLYRGTI